MKKERMSAVPVGACSLLTVLAVLCLTVLALLDYSSALADKRLSDAAAEAVKACYLADLDGEIVLSRLNNGETVEGIQPHDNSIRYSVPVSGDRYLEAELVYTGDSWQVKRWKTVVKSREVTERIPVFTGE